MTNAQLKAAAVVVLIAAGVSYCVGQAGQQSQRATAASASKTASVALQKADDQIRSDFSSVVSMNPLTVGGYPCDRACWDLKNLETDFGGGIPQAYKTAVAAYEGSNQSVPAEIAQWKTSAERVLSDIMVWDKSEDATGGVARRSPAAKSQVLTDLDKADALVDQIASGSSRSGSAS